VRRRGARRRTQTAGVTSTNTGKYMLILPGPVARHITAQTRAQPLEGARRPPPCAPGSSHTRPHDLGSPRCVRAHTHGRRTGLLRVEWFSLQAPGNTREPKEYEGEHFFRDAGAAYAWWLQVVMGALWQLQGSRPRRNTPACAGQSAPKRERTQAARAQGYRCYACTHAVAWHNFRAMRVRVRC